MDSVATDLFLNYPSPPTQFSRNQSEIDFFHRSFGKLDRQAAVRFIVLRHHHATARVLVEAMHNARPFFAADPGKGWAMMKERVDQRVLAMASARMNDQARRL